MALVVVFSGDASANEQSVFLTNQGTLHLEQNELEKALKEFRSAVEADGQDEDARYYLAHTYMLLGKHAEALEVLEDRKFNFWDADYLRGVSHMKLGRRNAAMRALRTSARDGENPRAWFYIGLLYYQDGQSDTARTAFKRAEGIGDDLASYREFYLGLIAAGEGEDEAAETHFRTVLEEYPGSPASQLSAEMLGVEAPGAAGPGRVGWSLRLMEQYDSNPALVQSDQSLAEVYHPGFTDTTGALRTALYGNLLFRMGKLKGDGFRGNAGVALYSSLHHFNHEAFDFNVLQPSLFARFGYRSGRWALSFPLSFAHTRLGTGLDPYSNILDAGGSFRYAFTDRLTGRTGLYAELHRYSSEQTSGATTDQAAPRDGTNLSVPLEVAYQFDPAELRLLGGYTFNRYLTIRDDSPWGFLGHRLRAGTTASPVENLRLFAAISWYLRSYDNATLVPGEGPRERTDNELGLELGTGYGLGEHWDLSLSYDGTFQSSLDIFSYNRHIVTLAVGVTY